MPERHVIVVVFKKRCNVCHGVLEAGPADLLPKIVGLPQVRCGRCGQATKLSLLVASASAVAGLLGAALAVVCCRHIAIAMLGKPLGAVPILLMVPIGLAAWILGYIAFAAGCYGIHGIWLRLRGEY